MGKKGEISHFLPVYLDHGGACQPQGIGPSQQRKDVDQACPHLLCVQFTPDQHSLFQCVYVCGLFFFCLTLPLRKNLLDFKRKAINIYFAFILQYTGPLGW